jgi:hypothetical protein
MVNPEFINNQLQNDMRVYPNDRLLKSGRPRKFTDEILGLLKVFIAEEYKDQPIVTIKDVKLKFESKVLKEFGRKKNMKLEFSISAYRRYISAKRGLNLSFKKFARYGLNNTNNHETKTIRKVFAQKIAYNVSRGLECVYIDESSFNLDFHPSYGWTARGQKSRVRFIGKKSHNITLLAAISKTQLLCLQIYQGAVRGKDFFRFLINMEKSGYLNPSKYLLILDN